MKNTQKGFIVPLLIAIIAVLVIGGGVYIFEQSKPKQVEQQPTTDNQTISNSTNQATTPSTDQYAGWKTYTSNVGGYVIKYPSNWTSANLAYPIVNFCGPEYKTEIDCEMAGKGGTLVVSIRNDSLDITAQNFCVNNPANIFCDKNLSKSSVNIGGKTGTLVEFKDIDGGSMYVLWKLNSQDNKMFELKVSGLKTVPGYRNVFDQMLSTFKFIPTTSVTTTQPSITVLSPNGGESFKQGDAMNIQWKTNIQGSHVVNIILQRTDETQTTNIAHNVLDNVSPNNGESKYTWIIPSNLSGSFKVRVSSPDSKGQDNIDNTLMDTSNSSFTISPISSQPLITPITVISPNGGESLVIDQSYQIKWVSNSTKANILLNTYDQNGNQIGNGQLQWIAQAIDNSGVYNWTPSTSALTISTAYKYKIRITKANDLSNNASDMGESAGFFTLRNY